MSRMPLRYEREDNIVVLTLDYLPVNAFGLPLRRAIRASLERVATDEGIDAVVMCGAGRGFSAGGDVRELGTPDVLAEPRLTLHLHPLIEGLGKPVVAALHGYAIGGGLETAMACHYRVASTETRIGLPEVTLGIIPLSGTQRLPRLIGMQGAIELILSGKPVRALELEDSALFDRLVPDGSESVRASAVQFAREVVSHRRGAPQVRERAIDVSAAQVALAAARARVTNDGTATDAHRRALDALAAAVESATFDEGMSAANAICEELLSRQVSGR
jgi:enoyl-CoA hydratase